jgi:RNA 2',3'-cyclic 3'-phosphodiesterase
VTPAPAAATARLFVALWPDAGVRSALVAAAAQWDWNAGAAQVNPAQLHLTLHFLGEVVRERLPELRRALVVSFAPFPLRLSRPTLWPAGIAVLEPERVPAALADLHAALGNSLRRLALPTEGRAFRPHVTLARRAAASGPPSRCPPVDWPVQAFALVESRPGTGYSVVQHCGPAAR